MHNKLHININFQWKTHGYTCDQFKVVQGNSFESIKPDYRHLLDTYSNAFDTLVYIIELNVRENRKEGWGYISRGTC